MGLYLGLDISLNHTGYCVLGGPELETGVLEPAKKGKAVDRLLSVAGQVKALLNHYDFKGVAIEDFAYSQSNKAHQIGEMQGLIRVLLYKAGYNPWLVGIHQLKKFLCGKAQTPKSLILKEVFRVYGQDFTDDNIADAYVLAKMAQGTDDRLSLTAARRDILSKLVTLEEVTYGYGKANKKR